MAHPSKRGRPSKLTPDVRKKILDATLTGASLTDVAAYAGISTKSLKRYREQDPAFKAEFEQAEATAAVGFCLTIKRASDRGEWKAAAWWLERRRPEDWCLKLILELVLEKLKAALTQSSETESQIDPEKLSVAELKLLREWIVRSLPAAKEETRSE
jgi:hypothetical protein